MAKLEMREDQGSGISPFSFGRNWETFVQTSFTPERLEIAKRHILDFLGVPDLKGAYFLDVGCGSGLSSLAALEAGAERVVSFDVDPNSVKTTRSLYELAGSPDHWTVSDGSALDQDFMKGLDPADIVYSWGVLHHTGSMWEALRNTAALMKKEGVLYIGLYLTVPKSSYWLEKKQLYNRSGNARRRMMEGHYLLRHVVLPEIIRARNPLKKISRYKNQRGMELMTDVRDWLGGYPYEHASIKETVQFCREELGLSLRNITPTGGFAEYLLEATTSAARPGRVETTTGVQG